MVGTELSIMYFEAFNACSLVVIIILSVTVVEDGVVVTEPFS